MAIMHSKYFNAACKVILYVLSHTDYTTELASYNSATGEEGD